MGEGKGSCFLRLHFLQAPWRREKGRERSPRRPGRLSEPVESGILSLTRRGFEDLQETYASHLHQGRREGFGPGAGPGGEKKQEGGGPNETLRFGALSSPKCRFIPEGRDKVPFLLVSSQNPAQARPFTFCFVNDCRWPDRILSLLSAPQRVGFRGLQEVFAWANRLLVLLELTQRWAECQQRERDVRAFCSSGEAC